MPKRSTSSFFRFVSASFSPFAGEAVALSAEETPVVVAPDTFSTRVANLFKDKRLEIVEVKVSNVDGISFRSPVGKQLAKSCEAKSLDSLGFREVTRRVKKADLVSFKISAKSSSFTFREMSSDPDSSLALEVVWVVFNPSLADFVLSTRTLGLDPVTSTMKSAKASCPDADSGCKIKEVDQADAGPPAACCASLCISPTTGMGGDRWLRIVSMAELDLVSFFERPDWDLDASVVDSD
nr:hypothetical protein [Tanacetum cinerariifolium]